MRSPNTAYLSRLDHLRFFAAALVVVFHYFQFFVPATAFANPLASLIREGHVGIGLFMVLSGFIFSVIAQGRTLDYGRFVFNRFIRIYPLYVSAVVLAVSMIVYQTAQSRDVFDVLAWLLAFRPPDIAVLPYFSHLWTIPVEFTFYLLFPFLHAFFSRHGFRYFLGLFALLLLVRGAVWIEYGTVRFLAYETLFGRLDQFLVGYLCGWLFVHGRAAKVCASPVALLATTSVMLVLIRWLNQQGGLMNMDASWWIWWPLVEGLGWGGLVLSYLHLRWQWPAWLDRGLALLGERSFSIYVVHMFVVVVLSKRVGLLGISDNVAVDAALSALLVAMPVTLLVASLTYAVIERPFLSYRKVYTQQAG